MARSPQNIITPEGRASYAKVWKPEVNKERPNDPASYRISLLFPKPTHSAGIKLLTSIKYSIENESKVKEEYLGHMYPMWLAMMAAVHAKWGDKPPTGLKSPFRDGDNDESIDLEKSPEYAGMIFVSMRSSEKPGIVDRYRQPIVDESDFYSGCHCRATAYAHPFDSNGNKGVTFLLNNLQKLRDDDRLGGGRTRAEDDFDELPDVEGGDAAMASEEDPLG